MRVAIIGQRVHRIAPGGDAVAVERDHVIRIDLVEDFLRDRFQIAGGHEVTGPVGGENEHVVVDGAGFEGCDHFLEQLAEGELLQLHVAARHFFPFGGVVFNRATDGATGLRDHDDRLPGERLVFLCGSGDANRDDQHHHHHKNQMFLHFLNSLRDTSL